MVNLEGSPTPWAYWGIRHLFKHALRVFYGNIVLEGVENIPSRGVPCILCPNHSNSLTDSLLVCTQIPAERREFIRPIAKSTLWGKRNFGSWLVENTGSVPVKRRRDFNDGPVDNSESMAKIIEALELGDMILMYPEGVSKYQPSMSPLKTGVARIVSDVLSRNRDNPHFEVVVATCSITYTHREHFRSDVLITFHPPLLFSPKSNPELLSPRTEDAVRAVTEQIRRSISSGTLNASSWKVLRAAKLATNIYAPLGTGLTLGSYVRLVKRFVEAFEIDPEEMEHRMTVRRALEQDLNGYQDQLSRLGLPDGSVNNPSGCMVNVLHLIFRLVWGTILVSMSLPGLLLWLPAVVLSRRRLRKYIRRGPASDTWDEIAEIKVSSGVMAGIPVWLLVSLHGLSYSFYSPIAVAALMWMSLRWMEDAVASFRSAAVALRLIIIPKAKFRELRCMRKDIRERVVALAIAALDLPESPKTSSFVDGMGKLESFVRYFSPLRRRKRTWNEVLRLGDIADYPDES